MHLRIISLLLIFSGIFAIAYSALSGNSNFALFVIFPVIYGSDPVLLLGSLLLMFGLFLFFASPSMYYEPAQTEIVEDENIGREVEEERKSRYGIVIMLGPIPIAIGSDRNMLLLSLIATLIVILALLLLLWV